MSLPHHVLYENAAALRRLWVLLKFFTFDRLTARLNISLSVTWLSLSNRNNSPLALVASLLKLRREEWLLLFLLIWVVTVILAWRVILSWLTTDYRRVLICAQHAPTVGKMFDWVLNGRWWLWRLNILLALANSLVDATPILFAFVLLCLCWWLTDVFFLCVIIWWPAELIIEVARLLNQQINAGLKFN